MLNLKRSSQVCSSCPRISAALRVVQLSRCFVFRVPDLNRDIIPLKEKNLSPGWDRVCQVHLGAGHPASVQCLFVE